MTQPPSHDPQDPNAPRSGAPDQWAGQPYGEQQPAYGQGQWPQQGQPGQEQWGQPGGQPQWGQPGGQPQWGGAQPGQPAPGQPPYGYGYAAPPPSSTTNVLAILSLVFAFFFSPAGIVLGHMALKQIRERGEEGEPLAKWGLILSYIFTGLTVLACCGYIGLVAFAISEGGTGTY